MPGGVVGDWIATGLLHGTVLALVTGLAVATLLRRARPATLALLWTVVLVKFLVPVGPRTSLSLSSGLERIVAMASGEGAEEEASAGTGAASASSEAAGAVDLSAAALVAAYLIGLAWTVGRRIARQRALVRRVRALPRAPADIVGRLRQLAERLRPGGIRLPVLRISPDAAGPYLVGCARPELVLPAWLDPATPAWSAAMTHELAHLLRRDPWLRALESAASALFYFWPPVAWICRRIDRAREMACDQFAIAYGPLAPRDYARLLVSLATRGSRVAPGALPLLRSQSQLGARVDQLLAGARPPALGKTCAGLVAVWASLCLAGAGGSAGATGLDGQECNLEEGLLAQILATHPDADADGDGILSQDEACAHQQRMRQRLLDRVVDAELVNRIEPEADVDGDGELSEVELEAIKDQFELALAPELDGGVVLQFGGEPVPVPEEAVRVNAAAAPARACGSPRCTSADVSRPGGFPLLIDVSVSERD